MGWKPDHGRIKEKYNPRPNAEERRFHDALIRDEMCICCWGQAETVHHVLAPHPEKRWRRDHRIVVPMRDACHRQLHDAGSEMKWRPDLDLGALGWAFWTEWEQYNGN